MVRVGHIAPFSRFSPEEWSEAAASVPATQESKVGWMLLLPSVAPTPFVGEQLMNRSEREGVGGEQLFRLSK